MKQRVVYLLGPERVELREETVPSPSRGEIILRVGAATTCGTDVKVFRRGGHPRMLVVPTPFGHEMAGTVHAVGDGVTSLRVGDRVVVANSAPCGECECCRASRENLCVDLEYLNGAYGEYLRVPPRFVERNTLLVPDELSFEIAAVTEPLACVLHGLDACELPNPAEGVRDVLVFGAGPIGLLFAGAIHALGHRATVADPNPPRLAVAEALGAHRAIAIERGGGQAPLVRERSGGNDGFDVAIDATGVPEVWTDAIASVRPGGLVNLFGGCAPGTTIPLDTHLLHYSEITVKGVYHHRPDTVRRALAMLAAGAFDASRLISRSVGLEGVDGALRAMMAKDVLKVAVLPGG